MTESQIAEIARRQLADYDAHRPGGVFEDGALALTVAEAYAVQRQVSQLRVARGEAIAGYNIGCISEAVRRQLGIDRPVFGHLFATELHRSGVVLDAAAFDCLAIEGEFALRLGNDLSAARFFPIIELHNHVFRGAVRTAQELIANNALHAGVALPSIASSGEVLKPGQIVLSGSPLPLYPVRPGDRVVVRGPGPTEVELAVRV